MSVVVGKREDFYPTGGHNSGDDLSSAVTITIPDNAERVMMQAIDQNVRYTLDGTTPTGSVGFQLTAGDPPIVINLNSGITIKVLEESASAELQYQFAE